MFSLNPCPPSQLCTAPSHTIFFFSDHCLVGPTSPPPYRHRLTIVSPSPFPFLASAAIAASPIIALPYLQPTSHSAATRETEGAFVDQDNALSILLTSPVRPAKNWLVTPFHHLQ
ncbi:hypothetical protein JCGZ_22058 [Jatropha curcas]|uniref:Uncharacterized protein n=1 Tax=Jatropha curcas TaxID=180498 RepID=A0A067JSR1_JATCU|nr:hypothetical protein JCGZ_22058 [Jatropha curcas]